MGILDFLFQGSPPSSVTTYGETTQDLPTWYSDYTQGLISRANAIAAEPYQAYTNPRIAGLDPAQQSAYKAALGLEGQYAPTMTSALQAAQQGVAGSALNEADPYFQQALGYNPATAASPLFGEAATNIRKQVGDTSNLAQPYLTQASQLTGQAGQTGLAGIQDYMNPYQQQVVDRIGELGARNLRENLLPQIQDRAIQAGQFGGSRQGEAIGRALRDTQESTLAQQAQALQSGYGQAAQQLAADKTRQLQAAGQTAALGQAQAGLESADLARYAQAGSQLGALGQMTGQLAGQAGTQALQVGQQTGALAGQDLTRQLQGAQQLGALGQQQAQLGLQNIGALEGAGAMQQQQAQRSLDQAYADFLSQREYDRNNIAFLNAAIRGLEIPTSTSTSSTGPASVYQPSPLSQLAQGAASIYGFNKLFSGK
jgi:hypothetical protein